MNRPNRRQFCRIVAAGGAALGMGAALLRDPKLVERTTAALGAHVRITVAGMDQSRAQRAIDAAFAELDRIESALSLYRSNSALSALNRNGVCENPPADLVAVLTRARQLSEKTQGAFDVTVQPLWILNAQCQQSGRLPTAEEIAAARRNVNWRRLTVSPDRIELPAGMAVTLNGLAQGFAADQMVAVLRAHQVENALVDAGEIGALGAKPSGEPWAVAVQHPRQAEKQAAVVRLAGRCLSTSGDYATRFDDEYRNHHVFDPRTGRSPTTLSSVSVAAPTACEADGLSTAILVLGPEAGLSLVANTPGVDALLVLKDGRTIATAEFPQV